MIQQLPKQVPRQRHRKKSCKQFREKAKALQVAAEEAKTAIPELTDAQKADLRSSLWKKERAGDTSTNWRKEDELFKVILKNYYIPELAKGELVDCKWTWNQNDNKNYCEVTYKDVAGDTQTVYLNYKLNDTRDDLVIFEKAEEVVSYDVKGTDGSLAFNINAENFRQISFRMIRIPQFMKITEWYTQS